MESVNLVKKAAWVRRKTLEIHAIAPETRIASSLSSVEIFTALYYSGVLKFNPKNTADKNRDRLIVSKGHGSISLYPILADLGYFDASELGKVCKRGSFLGGIPDTLIPGYETINGSLGHGLGVACGMAVALKRKDIPARVFVVMGDGELYEGSVWEAVMFAGYHKLDNLILVLDNNKICMLDYCEKILNLNPLGDKFKVFGWQACGVDGHDAEKIARSIFSFKGQGNGMPKVLIAETKKGKGIPRLESDSLCHIKSLSFQEATDAAREIQC